MNYYDLTINQRISLKGYFQTIPEMAPYRAIVLLWGFVKAVNYFLNNDINEFSKEI